MLAQPVKRCSFHFLRWNSTHDLLTSTYETSGAITHVLHNMPSPPVEFTQGDWKLMKKVVTVLKPFKEATLFLSKKDASISSAIPITTLIIRSMEEEDPNEDRGVLTLKRDLKRNMEERFSHLESKFHYTAATLLDSKFKHYFFRDESTLEETKEHIIDRMVNDLQTTTNGPDNQVIIT